MKQRYESLWILTKVFSGKTLVGIIFIRIFAIITNLYPYEKHTSVRVESICGRIQEYDLGESSVVVDSPESSHSFSRVADVLLPARIVRQDG